MKSSGSKIPSFAFLHPLLVFGVVESWSGVCERAEGSAIF